MINPSLFVLLKQQQQQLKLKKALGSGTLEKAGPLELALLEFQSQAVLLNC